MTENTTTETPAWKSSPFAELFATALESGKFADMASKHNALVAQIKSQGSEQDKINDVLLHSDDPNVQNYRKVLEESNNERAQWLAQIEEYARENLISKADFDVQAAENEAAELRKTFDVAVKGLAALDSTNTFVAELPTLEKLKNSGATGTNRKRWANLEIAEDSANLDDPNSWSEVFEMKAVTDKEGKVTGQEKVQTYSVLVRKYKELSGMKTDVATIYDHSNAEQAKVADGQPFTFALGKYIIRATPKND